MAKYQITNTISGVVLGMYDGETQEQALDAMARDAGYVDHAESISVAPVQPGELLVAPVYRYAVRFAYATECHQRGEIVSRHRTRAAAEKAAKRAAFPNHVEIAEI